jgi:hypothetical protein
MRVTYRQYFLNHLGSLPVDMVRTHLENRFPWNIIIVPITHTDHPVGWSKERQRHASCRRTLDFLRHAHVYFISPLEGKRRTMLDGYADEMASRMHIYELLLVSPF